MKVWKFYLCMGEVHGRNCALLEGKMPTWAKGLQMNQKRKIQRGKSPCKISPAAECGSEPGPQDAHAGCPGFQSWHLWSHSASTLLQPPILGSVNLPLVLVSQTGPLPNPSCRLNFVHTALLFICQRALTTSFSESWLWPCILQISQGWQCRTTFGEGLRITEWQKKGENKYFGIWIYGHPLAESLWLVLVSSHFYKLMFWRFCAQILMFFFFLFSCAGAQVYLFRWLNRRKQHKNQPLDLGWKLHSDLLDGKRLFFEFLNFSNGLIAAGVSAAC